MEKKIQIWELATSLDKTKRALIVFLSLEGKAREAVLELDTEVLNSEDGMKNLYEKLDTLFLESIRGGNLHDLTLSLTSSVWTLDAV